jgi:hypothetical protein
MAKDASAKQSPLMSAAVALDAELRRCADLAGEVERAPLTSEKALERVTRTVAEAVESDRRVLELLRAVIGAAQETQKRTTDVLNARGGTIAEKRAELEALLTRLRGIGEVARTLNEALLKVTGYKPDPYDADAKKTVLETLAKIEEGMGECARHADAVTKDAREKHFDDVARQSDGLRQQILSAKSGLARLQQQIGAEKPGPSEPAPN